MTPLDFRLIATGVFRLIALHCSYAQGGVDRAQKTFPSNRLVTRRLLSRASFHFEATNLMEAFTKEITVTTFSFASELIRYMIQLSDIHSALNTDVFQMSVPGTNHYQFVNNFYPLNDNASFSNVSYFFISCEGRKQKPKNEAFISVTTEVFHTTAATIFLST
jgi:hypothetical protein